MSPALAFSDLVRYFFVINTPAGERDTRSPSGDRLRRNATETVSLPSAETRTRRESAPDTSSKVIGVFVVAATCCNTSRSGISAVVKAGAGIGAVPSVIAAVLVGTNRYRSCAEPIAVQRTFKARADGFWASNGTRRVCAALPGIPG